MAELDRPSWCQDQSCLCLTSYDERICVGRLPEPAPHDDMFNTHNLCLDADTLIAINDADAYYLIRCLTQVREDIIDQALYHEGRGVVYDLKGGKP